MSRCEPVDLLECQWTNTLWSTIPIGLLVIGTFGNLLNVVILTRKRLGASSTSVYLLSLAFGDCTFLWTGMGPRILLQGFNIDIKIKSVFLCKVLTWLPVTAAGYSIWTLVLMTFERVMLTKRPIYARSRLTLKTARISAIVTLVLCVSLTGHGLIVAEILTSETSKQNVTIVNYVCTYTHGQSESFYRRIWPVIVLIVFNILPMALIVIGNLTIAHGILAQRRRLRRNNSTTQNQHAVPNKVKSVTKMLFLVSGMFMLTNLPFTIGNVIMSQQSVRNVIDKARQLLIYSILRNILYCNFTFNFVLYFVCGSVFKQEWKALIEMITAEVRCIFNRRIVRVEPASSNTLSTNPSDPQGVGKSSTT